jgi:hypothetical protein
MMWPFRKRQKTGRSFSLTPRSQARAPLGADPRTIAPPAADFLARAGVIQVALAADLSSAAKEAWSVEDADALMRASAEAMDRYRSLRELLSDYAKDPVSALGEPREALARHLDRLTSPRWYERVGTVYVLGGFTRDFFIQLAPGLGAGLGERIEAILADRGDEELLVPVIERVLAADERYRSRLSLWARRLVGDVMLVCSDAVSEETKADPELIARLEPLFVEPIAEHTRRLDRLGLTA